MLSISLRPLLLLLVLPFQPVLAQDPGHNPGPIQAGIPMPAPLFVANHGQWNDPASFRIVRGGAIAWLEEQGLRLDLHTIATAPFTGKPHPGIFTDCVPVARHHARLELVFGRSNSQPAAAEVDPSKAHFFVGADPAGWRKDVPSSRSVVWPEVAPGVSVRALTHATGLLEYVVEYAAGVVPANFELQWRGSEASDWRPDGSLHLRAAGGVLEQTAPVAWQVAADGSRLPVQVHVDVRADGRFAFVCDVVDAGLPVVVDPALTFYGGPGDEIAFGLAAEDPDRLYIAGMASPTGAWADRNAFVSCLDLSSVPPVTVWTTTIGGSNQDVALDLHRDIAGLLTIVGLTESTDFPLQNALQSSFGGGQYDGFLSQLDGNGVLASLSSYLGGSGDDWLCRVVSDNQLRITVAGYSSSTDFTTTPSAVQPQNAGGRDAVVVRLFAGGAGIDYATYYGGGRDEGYLPPGFPGEPIDVRWLGLDVDATGRILLCGMTESLDLPLAQPLQSTFGGVSDGFVAILDPGAFGAAQRVWSTYYGASGFDVVMVARFAPADQVVIAGAGDARFPAATPGAYQTTLPTPDTLFVSWLAPQLPAAQQVLYTSVMGYPVGANGNVTSLLVDGRGHATLGGYFGAGFPGGTGWPADSGGMQIQYGGGFLDHWIARIRPAGRGRQDLTHGTYLGGTGGEGLFALVSRPDGGIYLAGGSRSSSIPGVGGALQGPRDALVGRMPLLPPGAVRGPGASVQCPGLPSAEVPFLELDRRPTAGGAFELLAGSAPALGIGLFGFNFGSPVVPDLRLLPGAAVAIAPSPLLLWTVTSNALGAAEMSINLPQGWAFPLGLHVQALWVAPSGCQPFMSSATLSF